MWTFGQKARNVASSETQGQSVEGGRNGATKVFKNGRKKSGPLVDDLLKYFAHKDVLNKEAKKSWNELMNTRHKINLCLILLDVDSCIPSHWSKYRCRMIVFNLQSINRKFTPN